MTEGEYYKPVSSEEMVESYMGRIFAVGEKARAHLAQGMSGPERRTVYIEDGQFSALFAYSHFPGESSFQAGGLVIGAPNAYEVIYPLPIIRPDLFDCAFEIDYRAKEESPEKPFAVDFTWRQSSSSRFLSQPSAGQEYLSFEALEGWPMSRMNVRYMREEKRAARVTQSVWDQDYERTATPLSVSVVAHVVCGLEAILEKMG